MGIRRPLTAVVVLVALGAGLSWAWPRLVPRRLGRAVAAYDRRDWKAALDLVHQHLKASPNDPDAQRLLARLSARTGRDEAARVLFARLGGLETMQAEDLYLLGMVLLRKGEPELAADCWERGRKANPDHPELLDQLALRSLERDQLCKAAEDAERLAIQPGWERPGRLLLGAIREKQDDAPGVVDALGFARSRGPQTHSGPAPSADDRKRLARALLATGRCDEARDDLRALRDVTDDPEASWLLSRVYLRQGDWTEAAAAGKRGGPYRDDHPFVPEPAAYVGSARCAECHKDQFQTQRHSRHAHTFQYGTDLKDLTLPNQPVPDRGDPEVTHTFARVAGQVELTTRADGVDYRAFVDHAFGSGDRGLTLVGHDADGTNRELRVSRYEGGTVWDLTTGHSLHPPSGPGVLGRALSPDDVRHCLACHVTRASAARTRTGPESADWSIGCERCHGPGGNHLLAVAAGLDDLSIARPGTEPSQRAITLCAQCHSPIGISIAKDDPTAIRFQSTTLTWSRCYIASNGMLDCVTCHDPHRDADRTAAPYESKCLSCHSRPAEKSGPAPCPVNPARGCILCHMPVVKEVVPHTSFTDHHIRIHPRGHAAPIR